MPAAAVRVLVIGYGNPGRLDDGLGPALAEAVEKMAIPGVTVESDYQLTVEDASVVAEHDVTIFADASVNGPEPFFFCPLPPKAAGSFTSHSVEPGAVLALATELFKARVKAYILGIRGYEFNEFGERLSERARANLAAAAAFLEPLLRSKGFGVSDDNATNAGDACGNEDGTCKTENT